MKQMLVQRLSSVTRLPLDWAVAVVMAVPEDTVVTAETPPRQVGALLAETALQLAALQRKDKGNAKVSIPAEILRVLPLAVLHRLEAEINHKAPNQSPQPEAEIRPSDSPPTA